jgi:hypothetical protein
MDLSEFHRALAFTNSLDEYCCSYLFASPNSIADQSQRHCNQRRGDQESAEAEMIDWEPGKAALSNRR